METLDLLVILMILAGIIALEARDLLSSVVAVGAVGLGLSIVFLLLQAPDVAITQLAVEIIAVILLIRATLRTDLDSSPIEGRIAGGLVALVFISILVPVAAVTFTEIPAFGEPLMRVSRTYLTGGLQDTGAVNLVTSVILDYRAYDTLGEATVLLTAVVGVLTVLRSQGRRKKQGTLEDDHA